MPVRRTRPTGPGVTRRRRGLGASVSGPTRAPVRAPATLPGMAGWSVTQIERQVPPVAHTAIYNWHKYWARKTWNVIGEFVSSYCPPGGTVLDPFAGSGVTGIEAVRHGRRAILVDLVPIM